jgi:hypothetical protein
MVEVFKTDVNDEQQAEQLLDLIHQNFQGFQANFDLEDCDKILRVESVTESIPSSLLINILIQSGVKAEVLQ